MADGSDVRENMYFIDRLPQRVVGFVLKGDNEFEEIVVFFNPNDYPVTLHAFGRYEVYVEGGRAGNEVLRIVEDDYTVEEISAIVIARKRQEPVEESYESLASD